MKNSGIERARQSWAGMKQRCLNPRSAQYHNYGGRGISICERWADSFANFLADMGERPEGMTIERIDVNGNYEPSNCCWADRAQQRRNQRDCIHFEFEGTRLTAEEWGKRSGLHPETIRRRLRAGLTGEAVFTGDGLTTPKAIRDGVAKPHSHNKSGLRGVYCAGGRWIAGTRVHGVRHYLGSFDTPEQAHAAYVAAQKELRSARSQAKEGGAA